MINLTREDWCEIYYALETKVSALRRGVYGSEETPGEDKRWVSQLQRIKRAIGPDGTRAADRGVKIARPN